MTAPSKIHEAMAGIMGEITAIAKDKDNKQQGFKYRGIDDVYNHLNPILSKYGVFILPEILDRQREERPSRSGGLMAYVTLTVRYHFTASDGSSVSCTVVGEGMDSGDKATNKAMAIAHKYALLQTFAIPTSDMPDPDGDSPELGQPKTGPRDGAPKSSGKPAVKPAAPQSGPTKSDPTKDANQPAAPEMAKPAKKDKEVFFKVMVQTFGDLGIPARKNGLIQALSAALNREIRSSDDLTAKEMTFCTANPAKLKSFAPKPDKELRAAYAKVLERFGDNPPPWVAEINPDKMTAFELEEEIATLESTK